MSPWHFLSSWPTPALPAWLPVFISSMIHHLSFYSFSNNSNSKYKYLDLLISTTILFLVSPHPIACLLRPFTKIFHLWTRIIPSQTIQNNHSLQKLVHGGPLGHGCAKLCEAICAYLLLSFQYQTFYPEALKIGPLPNLLTFFFIGIFSLSVNLVLSIWSHLRSSRGQHEGVNTMVRESLNRSLKPNETITLLFLAIINAICEEITSRGFFLHELKNAACPYPNLAQAVSFGIWHYHGIPSGITGVFLTFVYGFIMGIMAKDGLLLPILTHSVADYFIFAVIARKEMRQKEV